MIRCVPIQVFPDAFTSLNSAAHCRREEREKRSFIRPWRTIISLRPRCVGRNGFQPLPEPAVFDRVDVSGPISLFHPLFSCARGIQTGAFACVLKADKFFSCGQNPGTLRVGKVNQRREIVNRGDTAMNSMLFLNKRWRIVPGNFASALAHEICVRRESGPAFVPPDSDTWNHQTTRLNF
jgi:hypothetical protein